jgi:hypothetical protein
VGKYFAPDPVTGVCGDIVVKHPYHAGLCVVLVGERRIGQVYKSDYEGWGAISDAHGDRLHGLRHVKGFRTRWYVIKYLLDVGVYPNVPGYDG